MNFFHNVSMFCIKHISFIQRYGNHLLFAFSIESNKSFNQLPLFLKSLTFGKSIVEITLDGD